MWCSQHWQVPGFYFSIYSKEQQQTAEGIPLLASCQQTWKTMHIMPICKSNTYRHLLHFTELTVHKDVNSLSFHMFEAMLVQVFLTSSQLPRRRRSLRWFFVPVSATNYTLSEPKKCMLTQRVCYCHHLVEEGPFSCPPGAQGCSADWGNGTLIHLAKMPGWPLS